MLVLGLDTSSPAVSAALVRLSDGLDPSAQTLAESVVIDARRHGELLAPGVQAVLAGTSRTDLGAVAVGLGPGPFTGLRVGLMTAAALCDALDVPAYGVCSLDAVPRPDGRSVAVVTDARRKEVYWARYDADGARVEGPSVDRPAVLAERLGALAVPPLLVGAGAVLHRAAFAGLEVAGGPGHPSAPALVGLVRERALAGAPADVLTPLYLRRPDAVEPGATKKVTA